MPLAKQGPLAAATQHIRHRRIAGWRGCGCSERSQVGAKTQRPLREPRAAAGGLGECPSFQPKRALAGANGFIHPASSRRGVGWKPQSQLIWQCSTFALRIPSHSSGKQWQCSRASFAQPMQRMGIPATAGSRNHPTHLAM